MPVELPPGSRAPVSVPAGAGIFACNWLAKHGREVGIDASRLAVGGDNSDADLSIAVLDRRRATLRTELLAYGCFGQMPECGYEFGSAAAVAASPGVSRGRGGQTVMVPSR